MSHYLPLEVLEEILHRLPLKSIVKCTCVCQAWKSLITNHDFISDHLSRTLHANHGNGSLFLQLCKPKEKLNEYYDCDEYYSLYLDNHQIKHHSKLKFPLTLLDKHWTLVGTCNGLVCFADYSLFDSETVIICNPSIKKYVVLPKPKPLVTFGNYRKYGVHFRFGYDSRNKDFKVLRLMTFNEETLPQVEVYSLSTGSWRSIPDRAPAFLLPQHLRTASQMLVNDALHWVVGCRSNGRIRNTVLSFDVVKETFREFVLPHRLKESCIGVNILVGLDLLAVHGRCFESDRLFHSIWVMQEYGVVESWTRVFHFDLSCFWDMTNILAFRSSGEVVLQRLKNGEIILLDPMKESVKDLGFKRFYNAFVGWHVESLFLINKEQNVSSY